VWRWVPQVQVLGQIWCRNAALGRPIWMATQGSCNGICSVYSVWSLNSWKRIIMKLLAYRGMWAGSMKETKWSFLNEVVSFLFSTFILQIVFLITSNWTQRVSCSGCIIQEWFCAENYFLFGTQNRCRSFWEIQGCIGQWW